MDDIELHRGSSREVCLCKRYNKCKNTRKYGSVRVAQCRARLQYFHKYNKQRCQNQPISGCAPNSAKTHTFTKLEKPKSTSSERLTWLPKRLLQTLTVCCCRTAENLENVPLSEHSLCRSSTVHCAKNDCLRYPCADASETKVRFSQVPCSHEISPPSLDYFEMTCTSFIYSLLGVLPMSTCHLAYRTSHPLPDLQVNLKTHLAT